MPKKECNPYIKINISKGYLSSDFSAIASGHTKRKKVTPHSTVQASVDSYRLEINSVSLNFSSNCFAKNHSCYIERKMFLFALLAS